MQIALQTKHAKEINVWILVLDYVALMLNVELSTIFLLVPVMRDIQETHSQTVNSDQFVSFNCYFQTAVKLKTYLIIFVTFNWYFN